MQALLGFQGSSIRESQKKIVEFTRSDAQWVGCPPTRVLDPEGVGS